MCQSQFRTVFPIADDDPIDLPRHAKLNTLQASISLRLYVYVSVESDSMPQTLSGDDGGRE